LVRVSRVFVHVAPPSVELAANVSMRKFLGSLRRSWNATQILPERSTSIVGNHWSIPSVIGSVLMRVGFDQVVPPLPERENNASPKQYVGVPPQSPSGSGRVRFLPSCQVTYTDPRCGPAERSTTNPWISRNVRKSPCRTNPSPMGVTGSTIVAAPKLTPPAVDLRILPGHDEGWHHLRVVVAGPPLELSRFIPVLESVGLVVAEEMTFALSGPRIHPSDHRESGGPASVLDLLVARREAAPERNEDQRRADGERLARVVLACWSGRADVDRLNELVLAADLEWDEVAVLRRERKRRLEAADAYRECGSR